MQKKNEDIFETIRRERNGVAEIHSAFQDFPAGVSAHYQLYKQIVLADGLPLPRGEREYLAVKTSEANKCPYCIGHHQAAFEKFNSQTLSEARRKLLQDLAQILSKEMWKAGSLKKSFLAVGFSEAEWQHAVMIVAYFNFANRCAHAMGLELEQNFETTCR